MAIFHLSVKIISRGHGKSACAAAAYRAAEKIVSEYDGVTSDYRKKRFVEDAIVLLPENAPKEYADRKTLWNAVEMGEKNIKAQIAREVELALPIELSAEEQRKLVLEYVQEQFVDQGMIADVCFHRPHKKPTEENRIGENPHCHIMLTMKPLDQSGKWEPKTSTKYLCEKDGNRKLVTAKEIKKDPRWEKLYCYKIPASDSDEKVWLTKSYVAENKDVGYVQVNKYPKRETIKNPTVEKWNSEEMLMQWRQAWAEKQNLYFETHNIDARVDHRSYKDQGLDLIPAVHEGKDIVAIERIRKEEYDKKIANGEKPELKHTEIRNLNIAIRQHNEEIRIIAEVKKLREQLESIVAPVRERIETLGQNIAEKLERIRAELIKISITVRSAVDIKGEADRKIQENREYIKDLSPIRQERMDELVRQRKSLKKQYGTMTGLFSGKKKEELAMRIERLDDEISVQKENQKYAAKAQKNIDELQITSQKTEKKISDMHDTYVERVAEYNELEESIPVEKIDKVRMERLRIRPGIEERYMPPKEKVRFHLEADRIDKELKCSVNDFRLQPEIDRPKRKIKLSLD